MYKKILLLVATFVCFGLAMYFTYFHRPPVDDILAANLVLHRRANRRQEQPIGGNNRGADDKTDDDSPAALSYKQWDRWIQDNKFISIGEIYDKCEGEDRFMIGRVVMLVEQGAIYSETFINVTLDKDVTGGEMHLKCQYQLNDLFNSRWDLCNLEDTSNDRILSCPIRAGRRKFIKKVKIPSYLPRGRYTTKAWLTDQDTTMIACGFADFTI